jgi:hypothetical protein
MKKNMSIIINVLKPLVKSGIISKEDLELIKKLPDMEAKIKDMPNPVWEELLKPKLGKYKTIKETCEIMRADRKTVYTWMKTGKLQYSRLAAKKVLIHENSIIKLIEDHKNK